jgi:CheY-like chemotaxis protein
VDIGLPGMDGYQIAAQVRSDPACRRVRLIAMTGYGQPEDCRRALDAGFDAHLIKPVRADDLARILDAQPVPI